MSNVPGEPYNGPFFVDLNHLRGILVDLPRGGTRHLRREQPGMDAVIQELKNEVPRRGAEAGIPESAYRRFLECTSHLEKIREVKGWLEKMLEVVKESEARYEHERENSVSQIADAVRSTARREGKSGILAPFEKLLRYNSQLAEKAWKSRRQNAAHADEETVDDGG